MRVIRVEGIEKCEDSEEIVWHNWNIITNKGEIICYDIKFLEKGHFRVLPEILHTHGHNKLHYRKSITKKDQQ